ncbi:MAG TPA: hypothetical protein VI195_01530 [Steroidobacteraceae bacterium]
MHDRPRVPVSALALVLFLSMAPGARAQAPAAETVPPTWAVWTPKELRFVYMGFTSHYSCDGLRDKMRSILLQLGARPDLKVREVPCSGFAGRPTEFPGVTVNMNVLAPWDTAQANASATPVPAHWKTVEISTDRDPLREAGDCELIEQVKSRVLPLFNAQRIEYHSSCIPNQLQIGGTQLKAELLIADEQGPPPAAAPDQSSNGSPTPSARPPGAPPR